MIDRTRTNEPGSSEPAANEPGSGELGDKIQKRLDELGMTQPQLAKEVGYSQATISEIISGKTKRPRKLREIATALGIPYEGLVMGRQAGPVTTRLPESSARQVSSRIKQSKVPVYGRAVGGDSDEYIFNGNVFGWEDCPPNLLGVVDAYAIVVDGSSMEPRYRVGETVFVDPNHAPRRGDDVIVQLVPDYDGDTPRGYIKQFRGYNDRQLILTQHNPDEDIAIDIDRVESVHTIVFHRP